MHTRESSDETSSAYDHVNETRDAYLCVTVLLRLSEMCRCFPVHRKQRKACNNLDLPGQKESTGTGKMVQQLPCLPHKYEDWGSDTRMFENVGLPWCLACVSRAGQ